MSVRPEHRWALAVFVAALSFASFPGVARGFVLKRTESGANVRWFQSDVQLHVDTTSPCGPTPAEVRQALQIATDAWRGFEGVPDVVVVPGRPPEAVGYDPREVNGNGVYVLCDWPFGDALAVTVSTHETGSGRLLDADIAINGERELALLDEADAAGDRRYDLASVLTHEVGHVLGLDESDVRSATMWAKTSRGDTRQRTLEPDDEEGVFALYEASALSASPSCSAVGRFGERRNGAVLLLFLGVVFTLALRRARGESSSSERGSRRACSRSWPRT